MSRNLIYGNKPIQSTGGSCPLCRTSAYAVVADRPVGCQPPRGLITNAEDTAVLDRRRGGRKSQTALLHLRRCGLLALTHLRTPTTTVPAPPSSTTTSHYNTHRALSSKVREDGDRNDSLTCRHPDATDHIHTESTQTAGPQNSERDTQLLGMQAEKDPMHLCCSG